MQGKVVQCDKKKGYGFIKTNKGRIFFCFSGLMIPKRMIHIGSKVSFIERTYCNGGRIRKQAIQVQLIQ